MRALELFFWIALLVVAYAYVGYGVLVYCLVRLKRALRPDAGRLSPADFVPDVTIVVPSFNEADCIGAKIANCRALDYPTDRLRILIVNDGSTDDTAGIARRSGQVEVLDRPVRMGKAAAINFAMGQVTSPIVILTDANALVNREAVREIVRHYADPAVGAVAGEKRIRRRGSAAAVGEGLYWRYESWLKRLDSDLRTVVGADGGLLSCRRELFAPLAEDAILDDFDLSLRIAARGYRVVYEPRAYATEDASASIRDELKRRVRIAAGGWQSMLRLRALLKPWPHATLFFQYLSHRVLRWSVVPLLLALLVPANIALAATAGPAADVYRALLLAHGGFYALALAGYLRDRRGNRLAAFHAPYYFVVANCAVLWGFGRFLAGRQSVTWERVRRAACVAGLGILALATRLQAQAPVLRVAAGDREVARAEVSNARGYRALPITLLVALGARVTTGQDVVVVRLFDDTLRFYPGYAAFRVNERMESLHSWTYQEDGVLFVAQWFFTGWLPARYPGRFRYHEGVLRLAQGGPPAPPPTVRAPVVVAKRAGPRGDSAKSVPGDTAHAAGRPSPQTADDALPLPVPQQGRDDPLRGVLLGFIDARVSGVYESNIDRDPVPRPSYGTVVRLGMGLQSARSRPFLMVRYDFGLHQFANSDEWDRTAHDVAAELAPSMSVFRLRLGGMVRLGSWTEDRQPANQIILRPQLEIRPTPIQVLSLYALHSARRIDLGTRVQRDTFLLAGMGFYHWWHGGGLRVDGRYEANGSEYERSRYKGWTAYTWVRVPLAASHRLTLETAHNRRRYARSFVDPAGTEMRRDRRWTSSVAFTSEFARARWELGLEYEFEDNASNDAYARYRAHRMEFTVRRRW
jgi:glycosyltransferase involved in cell wall biosynthesis